MATNQYMVGIQYACNLMRLIQGARDTLTQSSILFGIRNSKLMRTKNVSEERHAVTCAYSRQAPSENVVCNYRVTLRRRSECCRYCLTGDSRLRQKTKSNLIFLHLQNCFRGEGNRKECRICVLDDHRSDDNMSTLALSTLISHNYTTLNHCE